MDMSSGPLELLLVAALVAGVGGTAIWRRLRAVRGLARSSRQLEGDRRAMEFLESVGLDPEDILGANLVVGVAEHQRKSKGDHASD